MNKDIGTGFEGADQDAYAIPFLRVLQTNSPQVNDDEPSYIKSAKAGMFFNTVTGDLFGKEVTVIPVSYKRDFVEWKPQRGGFVRSHGADPSIVDRIVETDEKNNQYLDNGNIIQDTKNHFLLISDRLDDGPIILSLTSTGIKHSKKWMSVMRRLQLPNKKAAPMFSSTYKIWTVQNENDEGKWYQIGDKHVTAIDRIDWVNELQYEAVKAALELVSTSSAAYDSIQPQEEQDEF
jgi:hypothetical protein